MTSRSWCYTLNNFTDEEVTTLKALECKKHKCGIERGESETPHLQGTIIFKNATRLSALKKILTRAHWEPCKAEEASLNYCCKGTIIIDIDLRKQGDRSDLKDIAKRLEGGDSVKDIARDHPSDFMRYHTGIEKYKSLFQEPRDFMPEVVWLYGTTGTGKSHYVRNNEVNWKQTVWWSGKSLRWWQGYNNQEITVFDDFRADFCTFHELLRILDENPYTVEVKGGSRELNSKRMYITCPYHPKDVYSKTTEEIQQLIRRIHRILHCTKVDNNYIVTDVTEVL